MGWHWCFLSFVLLGFHFHCLFYLFTNQLIVFFGNTLFYLIHNPIYILCYLLIISLFTYPLFASYLFIFCLLTYCLLLVYLLFVWLKYHFKVNWIDNFNREEKLFGFVIKYEVIYPKNLKIIFGKLLKMFTVRLKQKRQ